MGSTGGDQWEQLKHQYWKKIQNLARTTFKCEPRTFEIERVWSRLGNAPRNKGIAAFWHHVCNFDYEWLQYVDTYKV